MFRVRNGYQFTTPTSRFWRLRRCTFTLLLILITELATAGIVHSDEERTAASNVGIVYPAVREPYRSIFLSIISGIEDSLTDSVPAFEIPESGGDAALNQWLNENRFDATIVLGRRGLDLRDTLDRGQRMVFGAVYANPSEVSDKVRTISMAPAPARLFDRLIELAPSTRRITVIHDSDENGWLLELGRAAARSRELELNIIYSDNIRDAANAYRKTLRGGNSGEDAIWLLQGSRFLKERSLLDMILMEAWRRNLVVFSSNPSHVPKGALFALYPDNRELGQDLASAARRADLPVGVTPVEKLNTAVNVRTADHLGINVERALDGDIDMAFPSR